MAATAMVSGFEPGTVIDGRYRVIDVLGDGATSTVYLAEHMMIRRHVAIKVMVPALCDDRLAVERFMNEARAAGTLGDPHIIASTDMGFVDQGQRPYIVFEHLVGSVLTEHIYNGRKMAIGRVATIADQIASALHAAHAANLVHRDIKSDNIFLVEQQDGRDFVKVLDFGISKFLHHDRRTRSGVLMGTPEFMAPEQIHSPDTVDLRVDVYALGVVMYEMTEGRRPFASEDSYSLLRRIVSDNPPPFTREALPEGFAELVFKMLAKDPNDRFQTMDEVRTALIPFDVENTQRQSRSVTLRSTPPGGFHKPPSMEIPRLPQTPAVATRRQTKWPAIALAAAAAVVGASIWVNVRNRGSSEPAQPSEPTATVPWPAPTAAIAPPPPVPAPVPVEPVLFWVTSDLPDAHVTYRRKTVTLPITEKLKPSHELELVEVSARGYRSVRYWLAIDHPIRLQPTLVPGSGVTEASDLEIKAALGEIDPATGAAYQVPAAAESNRGHDKPD